MQLVSPQYPSASALLVSGTYALLIRRHVPLCTCRCDSIIGIMLKFDENSPEDIDCAELCPFGLSACRSVCDRLVHALKESSRYPCVSIGMSVLRGALLRPLSEATR